MASLDESAADTTRQEFNRQDIDELLDIILNVGNFQTMEEVLDHVFIESLKSSSSSISSIKYYISRGADLHAYDSTTVRTAFDLAVIRGDKEIIQLLIDNGLDALNLNIECYENIAQHDRIDVLELLISSCDKTELFATLEDELGNDEYSPLYWAVKYHKYHIIRFLINEGMDVDSFIDDGRGYNLLHHAAEAGDEDLVEFLLELGANVYRCTKRPEFRLPFKIAADKGHMDLAVKLLPHDINAPDPKPRKWMEYTTIDDSGFSMLMYACYAEQDSSAKMLVEQGADPNKAVCGVLPLQIAIINRTQKVIDYLYQITDLSLIKWKKENLDEALSNCLDILQFYRNEGPATIGGKPLLTYLLRKGVELNQPNAEFFKISPLMTACITVNTEHMKTLLAHGANPNIPCMGFMTYGLCNVLYTLVITCEKRYEAWKVLLQANPDVLQLSSIKFQRKVRSSPLPDELAENYKCTTVVQEALLSKDGKLITLCVQAGCCLYDTKFVLDVVKDSIEPPLKSDIIELIEKYDSSPRSLDHLAKFAARRCLGHKDVDSKIDALHLPQHMKTYLKYVGF